MHELIKYRKHKIKFSANINQINRVINKSKDKKIFNYVNDNFYSR